MIRSKHSTIVFLFLWTLIFSLQAQQNNDDETLRVFIFAGQSNMVGSDSKVKDIKRFPPFEGLEAPQRKVLFSYCIGRQNKIRSNGWVALQHVNNVVGPELSFARKVTQHIKAPIAIIKCAAGGTHLGGDWNPDEPIGFKMYPLTLDLIKSSLADLDKRGIITLASETVTLEDYYRSDAHWRPSGHEKAAEAISQWLQRSVLQ